MSDMSWSSPDYPPPLVGGATVPAPAIALCDCTLPAACGRAHAAPFFTWRSDDESARLHPADLEAIARRVAELLRGAP